MKKLDFVFVGLTILAVVYIAVNWNSGSQPNNGQTSSTSTESSSITVSTTSTSTMTSGMGGDGKGGKEGVNSPRVDSNQELPDLGSSVSGAYNKLNFFDPVFGLRMNLPKGWVLDKDSNFSDGLTFRKLVNGVETDLIYFTRPATDLFTDPSKASDQKVMQTFSESGGLKPAVVWFNGMIGEMCAAHVTTRGAEGETEFKQIMASVRFEQPSVLVTN